VKKRQEDKRIKLDDEEVVVQASAAAAAAAPPPLNFVRHEMLRDS
jgi:hypothetical protein